MVRSKTIYDLKGELLNNRILKIIHTESPVHIEHIYTRICDFQNAAITQKAKKHIQDHIDSLVQSKGVLKKKDIIWSTVEKIPLSPRNYSEVPEKSIALIAPEELDEAFRMLLQSSFGSTEDEVIPALCKQLGFRKTETVTSELSLHLRSMINRKIVSNNEAVLRLT